MGAGELVVLRAGLLTTVQDIGRIGWAHLAVGRSGALDQPAYALANRLVGNPAGAAALETTLDGVRLLATADTYAVVTGALAPVTTDRRPAGWSVPFPLRAGQVLEVGRAERGVRCYLAFAGGIAVAPVLGSRSHDVLSGLGTPVLQAGDRLPLGEAVRGPARVDFVPSPALPDELVLGLQLGPRQDWVTPAGIELLRRASWVVSADSNRVGLRLDGPSLPRRSGELASEGVVLGSVQVPSDGRPVIFLADHPTTGGYPVVGVIVKEQLWQCGQARPGMPVRFQLQPGLPLRDRHPAAPRG